MAYNLLVAYSGLDGGTAAHIAWKDRRLLPPTLKMLQVSFFDYFVFTANCQFGSAKKEHMYFAGVCELPSCCLRHEQRSGMHAKAPRGVPQAGPLTLCAFPACVTVCGLEERMPQWLNKPPLHSDCRLPGNAARTTHGRGLCDRVHLLLRHGTDG